MSRDGLVEVSASDWDPLLERLGCADAYLRCDYVRASCLLEPGQPVLLHLAGSGGDVVCALIVRDDPADAITPYGYGGPVGVGAEPPVARYWELYEDWCRERGLVTSFFRFHPLFANHTLAGGRVRLEPLAETISWPLRRDEDLYEAMHADHRRLVRRARGAGLTVAVEDRPVEIERFVSLYEQTMARKETDSFYFFPAAYWEELARLDCLVRADVNDGEQVVASALFLAAPPWLHYHLSASSEAGHGIGASRLLLLETAEWACERGYDQLHLGGGHGGRRDGLHRFKSRFTHDADRETWIGKAVHDPDRYLELSGLDEPELEGFFPVYRRPAAARETTA